MKRFYFYRFGGTLLSLIALSGCPTLTSPQVDKVKQEKENTKAAANLAANIPSNLVSLTGAISNSLTPTISGTTAIGAKVALFGSGPGLSILGFVGNCRGTLLAYGWATETGSFALTSSTLTGGDGNYSFSVQASDDYGNTVCSSALSYTLDTAPPTIALGAPTVGFLYNDPLSTSSIAMTFSHAGSTSLFNGDTGHVTLVKTGTANCSTSFSGVSTAGATLTLSSCTGNGTVAVKLNAGVLTAPGGTTNAQSSASTTVTVNNTRPTVAFGAPSTSFVHSGTTSTIALTFSGATSTTLTNGDTGDLTLVTTGTATCSTTFSSVSTAGATVTLSNCTGDGTVAIKLNASTLANNAGLTNLISGASSSVTVNNTRPTVAFGAPSTSFVHSGTTSTIALTFSGATSTTLTNGDTGDLTLVTTGTATCSTTFSSVTNTGATVTLSNCTGDGTVAIKLNASTLANNAGLTNLISGASSSVTVNNTRPTVAFGAPSSSIVNSSSTSTIVLTFSGAASTTLTNGDIGDLTLVTTGTATCSTSFGSVSTAGATVTMSNCVGDGTVAIKLNAGTLANNAGLANLISGASSSITVNNTRPTVAFGVPSTDFLNSASTSTIALTFSGADTTTLVNGGTGDLTLATTGTATCSTTFSSVTTAGATVTLSNCTGDGTVAIKLNAGTLFNNALLANLISGASSSVTVNNTRPTVAFGAPSASPINQVSSSTIALTFTGAASTTITNGDTGNLTLVTTGTATCDHTFSGVLTSGATVTLSNCTGDGTVAIKLNADTLTSNSGLNNVLSGASGGVIVDNTAPIAQSFSKNTAHFSSVTFPSSPFFVDITMNADTDMTTVLAGNFTVTGSTCAGASITAFSKTLNVVRATLSYTGSCADTQTLVLNYDPTQNDVYDIYGNKSVTAASRTYTMDIFTKTDQRGNVSGSGIYLSGTDTFLEVLFSKTIQNSSISLITSLNCGVDGVFAIAPVTEANSTKARWTLAPGAGIASANCTIDISTVKNPDGVEVDASTTTATFTSVTD